MGETLYLYIGIVGEALSVVLVHEFDFGQNPIYFVSKAFKGPRAQVEKVAFALVVSVRRLRPYFVAH